MDQETLLSYRFDTPPPILRVLATFTVIGYDSITTTLFGPQVPVVLDLTGVVFLGCGC